MAQSAWDWYSPDAQAKFCRDYHDLNLSPAEMGWYVADTYVSEFKINLSQAQEDELYQASYELITKMC